MITAAVTNKLIIESGNSTFHPKFINWSYLNLGTVHRTQIKNTMKIISFTKNEPNCNSALDHVPSINPIESQNSGNGKLHPPK